MTLRRFRWAALLALLLPLAGGCDSSSFEPYAETNQPFSLFGLLRGGNARQCVRVEPLQQQPPFGADSTIDAAVTLTRMETDRTVPLDDHLDDLEGLKHNFCTDAMDLRLNETYRLTARRSSDETVSTATTTMPHARPRLSLAFALSPEGVVVPLATIEGGKKDRLLFVIVKYRTVVDPVDLPRARIPPRNATFQVRYTNRVSPTETGYEATLKWRRDVRNVYDGKRGATVVLESVDAVVGLVHPSTPSYEGRSYRELFRPGIPPSNAENGYGLVAGLTDDRASLPIPPAEQDTINVSP